MKSLQNLSYKTLFTILFLALAGIVFLLKISGKTQKVSAAWWNDSWHYRQAINISSHNSLESNVYITTSVNIGTTAKAQIDDGDFRFISQSGENLSYYIVSGAGTTNVSFHILIPSFPAGTSTIYAYYGNSTIENGFSAADFSTQASNYTIGSLSSEEGGGGPIAYWKFDEGIGTTAYDSVGPNNGTFSTGSSAPTWADESQCISGKCLHFNGVSTAINGGNNQSLNLNTAITVQSWVKFDQLDYSTNTGTLQYILKKGYPDTLPSNFGWWFAYDNRSNRNSFAYTCFGNSAGGYSGGGNNFSSNSKTFSSGIWYLLSFTVNSTEAKLYINGTQYGPTKIISNLQLSDITNNLYIGNGVNGYLDEVKIYPYIRTADQIKQDYNSRGTLSGSSANLGIQSSTTPDLNSSLVAHYKFDENTGITTYDSSPNKKTGTLIGNTLPTWSSNCKSKNCINFTATNGTKISTNATYNNSSEYTISAYIYPTSVNADQFRIILGSAMGNNIDSGLVLPPDGSLNICYHNYSGTGDTNYCSTTNPIILNQWQYVALTFNNNQVNVYHNGINVKNTDVGKTNTNNYAVIGGSSNYDYSGRRFFNGSIDEVKIYNKALTPDEIKQDYNGSSAIQFGATNQTIGGTTTSLDYCIPGDTTYCAPPVAEWKMDEGVGTSIVDTSGNSNTGTISGATFTQGKIGKSLSLNGTSDYVSIPTYNYTTNATISVWVKGSYANGNQIIVGSPNSIALGLYNSGSDKALIGFAGTLKAVGISNNFINDSWNQLTVTLDGSGNAIYYCNGQLLSNSGTNYWTWSNGTYIGRRDSGSYFKGQIDQLKIYNYARTPAQVAYDYNRGGPVGWWKMDECQGSTIYDWSGNGNNGTLTIGSNGTQNSIGTCQIGTSAAWTNGATGKFNSSLNLDGTDDSVLLSSTLPINTGDFTISLWTKISSTQPAGTTWHILASNKNAPAASAGFGIVWNSSENKFLWSTANGSTSSEIRSQHTWESILDKWAHIVMVRKSGATNNGNFFINGIYEPLSSNGTILDVGTSNFMRFGTNSSPYTSYYFQGQIDDVRVYNYALTPDQVKQIYNGGAVNFN